MGNSIAAAIFALFIVVVAFHIFRAIVLWYWRVGEAIDLLRSIDEKFEHIAQREPHVQ